MVCHLAVVASFNRLERLWVVSWPVLTRLDLTVAAALSAGPESYRVEQGLSALFYGVRGRGTRWGTRTKSISFRMLI